MAPCFPSPNPWYFLVAIESEQAVSAISVDVTGVKVHCVCAIGKQ